MLHDLRALEVVAAVQAGGELEVAALERVALAEDREDLIPCQHPFTAMEHYVPFNNETDLLGAIEYYLKNDEARNEIVTKAFNKMKSDYNSFQWWNTVINKAVENL
jgi:spore maturation protein CgeB